MTLTRRSWLSQAFSTAVAVPVAAALGGATSAASSQDARTQWNSIYAAADFPYKTDHNAFLARVILGRTPGTALDIGMGRGRNSLYLASQGWRVTGVDIADEGLRVAAIEARQAGLTINAVLQDFGTFDAGQAQWDLIAGIYMGDVMTTHAQRIVAALKPGGMLVIENFARDANLPARVGGQPLGYAANELLRAYPALRLKLYEDTVSEADWGRKGRSVPVVRFAAEQERV